MERIGLCALLNYSTVVQSYENKINGGHPVQHTDHVTTKDKVKFLGVFPSAYPETWSLKLNEKK